jgi:predicted lipid-binding transport protein (Tim44 family)
MYPLAARASSRRFAKGPVMESGGFLDIIFFALVAGFLILRLRSVLGRRTGHQQKPRDALARQRREEEAPGRVIELPDRTRKAPAAEAVTTDDKVAAGLTQIQIADPNFDPAEFLNGARAAFEMIVHAFATGDTGTLRSLLSDEVFASFQTAIKARLEKGETLETTVVSIKSADLVEAALQGRTANLTIKFVTEQVNVTRDTAGNAVEGDPNRVTEVTDLWTFARDTRARDPNWKLVETRSPN